jgi:large subunit ribosomal protein L35
MPKNKSHSGAKKRFKTTGSGKLMFQRAGKRHLLERKSSRQTRRMTGMQEVAPADVARVERLLGR